MQTLSNYLVDIKLSWIRKLFYIYPREKESIWDLVKEIIERTQ